MPKTVVFTIASQNYIAYVRTLLNSVEQQHPESDRFLLLVDEPDAAFDLSRDSFTVVLAKDIGIESFNEMSFKYDIMELNTAVKPFFMKWLLQKGYKKVVYFDPDIMLFNSMDIIFKCLENYSIVITPHITSPIPFSDKFIPGERDYLSVGTYNLGFIAISESDESHDFLNWWAERCQYECFSEVETGYFVDQKWINLVPGLFNSVKILRDPGCNMAYWNLHERYLDNGVVNKKYPLVFFHFSGIDPIRIGQLSKYQDRYTLESRADIRELFELYRKKINDNGYLETVKLPYAYDCYDNGVKIGALARRMYSLATASNGSPFNTGPDTYYNMLMKKRLLEKDSLSNYTKENTIAMRKRLNFIFKFLVIILGVERYNSLMKYLRFMSVLRKQSFLVRQTD
ncbi:MAG: glycosyltransferase family protein [Paludibacteraceae bacterium]